MTAHAGFVETQPGTVKPRRAQDAKSVSESMDAARRPLLTATLVGFPTKLVFSRAVELCPNCNSHKRTWKAKSGETREAWIVDYADQLGRRPKT